MKTSAPSQPPASPRIFGGQWIVPPGLITLLAMTSLNLRPAMAAKPNETTSQAIRQLASDRWAVRSHAQHWLLRQNGSTLSTLMAAVLHTQKPEQKGRLIRICLQDLLARLEFVAGPRPLIGINFFPRHLTLTIKKKSIRLNAAQVISVLPGFPAGRVLQSGDIILALDSHPFPRHSNEYTFPLMLGTYPPGKTVNLLVMRRRKLRIVAIRLIGISASPTAMIPVIQQHEAVEQKFIAQYWPWGHPLILTAKRKSAKK